MARRFSVITLILLLWSATAWPQTGSQSEDAKQLFVQIEEIVSSLGEITGLTPKQAIQRDLITRAQVRQFLEKRIAEEVKPEELRAEELVLKKFGFVPADFDLKKTMLDLLTEQAAAFYDFRAKKLFVLDSAPSMLQQLALVHELAHALADQHFDLEKFIDSVKRSDDEAAARLAVMEGQATWLMSEYMARRMGQSLATSPAIVQMMSQAAEMSAGQFPVFDAAPLYMRETLMFPYVKGMLFQQALVEKKGKPAFVEIFRRPPVSSQQILHPDKYFSGVKPADPELPALETEAEYREVIAGSIGELDHEILVRQYTSKEEAAALAPRWAGGKYRLVEHTKEDRTVLGYVSEWESPEAARQFFQQYRRVLKGKWKRMEVATEKDGALAGIADDGHFLLRLDGSRVSSLEGMKTPREAKTAARAKHAAASEGSRGR